ncbi:MAG: cytochrome c oxidase assembly protein [Chromatiaceae bacterium]|nr:cytochrome c oxidase assembly protein [Gammaproteobacteria bacterium]MCP5300134.1 cytochrome c oxidase assembly protein [Chromatiaceae bacterium]MCP5422206.1 cytochrome c oxidase assembly protein [Chromatiaceae bacterium]
MTRKAHNGRSSMRVAIVAVAMFGFGYLLVPLYNVFCELTGLNGKTGRIDEAEVAARYQPDVSRTITVQFVANNNADMPWEFGPVVATMKVHPGQIYATAFTARNPTGHDMVGQAVPSVAPSKASRYFNKTECFCFNQQPLAAGEKKEMPLRFIIDPKLPADVATLTLAYTVFDVTQVAMN